MTQILQISGVFNNTNLSIVVVIMDNYGRFGKYWSKFNWQGMRCLVNSVPKAKVLDGTQLKAFADSLLNVAVMIILSLIEYKTLQEKEKMLVISIFFFSYNVFHSDIQFQNQPQDWGNELLC